MHAREWPISEVARRAGTTSRTLRHYGQLGLLEPSRIGDNGYRYYDRDGLVRLQRILLLRDLGLSLAAIREVLDKETDTASALRQHLRWLDAERERMDRQRTAVERTLAAITNETEIDMNDMLDGFDHRQYEAEVAERWGADAAARSSAWWESQSAAQRAEFQQLVADLNAEWQRLALAGADPTAREAQELARRHVAWLASVPGTPAESGDAQARRDYVAGLADMYVDDARFAANYGGEAGARFVRAALQHFVAGER